MPDKKRYEVCPMCEGEGSVVHRSLSVWTESDRAEDPEGFEAMLDGRYDVVCPECGGKRVVTQADEEEFAERERDRRTRFMESGIYPGSPDFY
jgi:rubredoxin